MPNQEKSLTRDELNEFKYNLWLFVRISYPDGWPVDAMNATLSTEYKNAFGKEIQVNMFCKDVKTWEQLFEVKKNEFYPEFKLLKKRPTLRCLVCDSVLKDASYKFEIFRKASYKEISGNSISDKKTNQKITPARKQMIEKETQTTPISITSSNNNNNNNTSNTCTALVPIPVPAIRQDSPEVLTPIPISSIQSLVSASTQQTPSSSHIGHNLPKRQNQPSDPRNQREHQHQSSDPRNQRQHQHQSSDPRNQQFSSSPPVRTSRFSPRGGKRNDNNRNSYSQRPKHYPYNNNRKNYHRSSDRYQLGPRSKQNDGPGILPTPLLSPSAATISEPPQPKLRRSIVVVHFKGDLSEKHMKNFVTEEIGTVKYIIMSTKTYKPFGFIVLTNQYEAAAFVEFYKNRTVIVDGLVREITFDIGTSVINGQMDRHPNIDIQVNDVHPLFQKYGHIFRINIQITSDNKIIFWVEFETAETAAMAVTSGDIFWKGIKLFLYPSRIPRVVVRDNILFSKDFTINN